MMNVQSAKGLQEVVKSNLGPKGTLKMCACSPAPRRALAPAPASARCSHETHPCGRQLTAAPPVRPAGS